MNTHMHRVTHSWRQKPYTLDRWAAIHSAPRAWGYSASRAPEPPTVRVLDDLTLTTDPWPDPFVCNVVKIIAEVEHSSEF